MQSPSQPEDRGLAARGAVVQRKLITRLSRQLMALATRIDAKKREHLPVVIGSKAQAGICPQGKPHSQCSPGCDGPKPPRGTRRLPHGAKCYCGTCGAPGTWDDMQHGSKPGTAEFEDAIWYNPEIPHDDGPGRGGIECHECWLK